MKKEICFDLQDGKYTVCVDDYGCVSALRYKEPWRDCVGDNLIRALAERVIELQQWKDDAMKVQSSWDAQEVGTLLNMQLGSSILPQIEPAIRKLIKQRDELLQAIEGYDTTAVNDPKWQHRVNDAVDNCIKA